MIRPAFANLIRNYRSHPAILAVPSVLFYNDTLIPEAFNLGSLQSWSGWKRQGWPVMLACNVGYDEIEQDGGGWYNLSEARKACDYAVSLLQSGPINQEDICIISPFSAQVRMIIPAWRDGILLNAEQRRISKLTVIQVRLLRKMIRAQPYSLWQVNIGPMEAFQGLESRVVIVRISHSQSQRATSVRFSTDD